MPGLSLTNHPSDDVVPCVPQHLLHIRMRGTGVIVKELDPPVPLSADFAGRLQDGTLEQLTAIDSLNCAD
jgi:hypothetical protein